MKLKSLFIACAVAGNAGAQTYMGPHVSFDKSFFDKHDSLNLNGSLEATWGFDYVKDIEYYFAVNTGLYYSYKGIKEESDKDNYQTSNLRGQFIEIPVLLKFSLYDDQNKLTPYGIFGIINSINIVRKDVGEGKMFDHDKFRTYLPIFNVGLGASYSLGLNTKLDFALNYKRGLQSMLVDKNVRFNQFGAKLGLTFSLF